MLAGARSSAPVPTSRGLSAALSGVLGSRVLGKQAGAEVIDPGTGRVLFARGASDLLQPASTTKLVTAAAALDVLGPVGPAADPRGGRRLARIDRPGRRR